MRISWSICCLFVAAPVWAAVNVPLTVQEALFSGGTTGVARTNEPFCMGVPLADSAGITSTSSLALTGASAGQFRVLGTWPDGNYKWVKVCGIIPNLTAGGTATVTLASGGNGNFGGSNLAVDNGTTITVSTGTAQFTIKKANFNVIDSAVIGGTTVLASSTAATRGMVIMGPSPTAAFPGNVTCGTCTTLYSSANDPNSAAVIEENGPVMTVIKATGNHMDASGHPYMQYTVRLYFYQGKNSVRVVSSLRNANYDTSTLPSADNAGNTFNTAYKGFQSYELRVSPSIAGTLNYNIEANGLQTGTLNQTGGTDSAYIYQGASEWMIPYTSGPLCDVATACANTYTTDTGFVAKKNGASLAAGSTTQYPQGWADISNGSGVGLEIGIYQMAASWPASLEFDNGGADVRIGLFSARNSQPEYQAWPASATKESYLIFHTSTPSYASEFLKLQHPLVARAAYTYYNAANVFAYPIADPGQEDAFYVSVQGSASPAISPSHFCYQGGTTNCTPDRGTGADLVANSMAVGMYRGYVWPDGGPLNQEEFRWNDMLKFLQRGYTGRWVNSSQFYRFFAADRGIGPHADGTSSTDSTPNHFNWRNRIHGGQPNAELGPQGFPQVTCGGATDVSPYLCGSQTNSNLSLVSWALGDALHGHWSGILDFYFLTGDEAIHDAIIPVKDYYMNTDTYQGGVTTATGWPTRAVGIELISSAKLADFLVATGDPDSATVLGESLMTFNTMVKPDTCIGGVPAGCTAPPVDTYPTSIPDNEPTGVSRARGIHTAASFRGSTWCADPSNPNGTPHYYRAQTPFQSSILLEGILALRRAEGPSWSDYNLALDLSYGISQWALSESFTDDGQNHWFVGGGTSAGDTLYNGFRFGTVFDLSQLCPASSSVSPGITSSLAGTTYDVRTLVNSDQGMWINFYVQSLMTGRTDWLRKLDLGMDFVAATQSVWPADWGGYQIGALVSAANNSGATLQDVPFSLQANGGSYTLTWTVPSSTQNYRIKWSPKIIAPSSGLLNFDPLSNTYGLNPSLYSTWFGANLVTEPTPLASGQSQSFTINAGTSGLSASNFSVKAYVSGSSGTGPAATLSMVSGNGQSGLLGLLLGSPLVVEVTDSNGSPVAGTAVTFAITAGGGSLSATSVITNSSGIASTSLTLGLLAGLNTVTASVGGLFGSPVTFSATAGLSGGTATTLALASGGGQSGAVGQQLANPFVVKVTDSNGTPVSGTTVVFAVAGGGGSLSAASVASNSSGLASSTLTLGTSAGINTVTATAAGLNGSPVTFTATGTAGTGTAATVAMVSGSGQNTTAGQQLANPFVVKVTDANGSPVSGTTVTFAVTGGGGSLSATSVASNSSGLASTTLTLGTSAGINTVTATAAGLNGSPVTFTATGATGSGTGGTWTREAPTAGWPSFVGWMEPMYDPVSQQTLFYVGPVSSLHGIYSTDMYAYSASTNVFTHITGTGSTVDQCPADTPTRPGDRHPGWQMAVDTKRGLLWMYGGLGQGCNGSGVTTNGTAVTWTSGAPFVPDGSWNGVAANINGTAYTVASVTDANHLMLTSSAGVQATTVLLALAPPNTNPRADMYYLQLNFNPVNDAWHQVTPAHLPLPLGTNATMTYDPDDDVLFVYGYDSGPSTHDNWVYCRTAENPTPGTLTAKQAAAGCAAPDDWAQVNPVGGLQPPASYFPGMVYDTVTRKAILYGGGFPDGATFFNQTWAYDVPSHTWAQKALSTSAPPVYNGGMTAQPALAYNSATNKIIFHQTSNTGAPADWQYDPVADTWGLLLSGAGAASDQVMAYDAAAARLIGWSIDSSSGMAAVWQGTPPLVTTSFSPCDLNKDGLVNSVDVGIAVSQTLGTCGNADLIGNGACSVLDVQRVVYAMLGNACITGQQ